MTRPQIMSLGRAGLAAALICAAIGASGCGSAESALPYYLDADLTPVWMSDADAADPATHRVADFELVDQTGRDVTSADLKGRIVVVNFFFTECGDICPTTRAHLARVRDALDDDRVLFVSYSVAPHRDSVDKLARWAESFGIQHSGWRVLTGDAATIERLAADSYFVELSDGSGHGVETIAHTENVILLDPELRIRGVYTGTLGFDMQQLQTDVKALRSEWSDSR